MKRLICLLLALVPCFLIASSPRIVINLRRDASLQALKEHFEALYLPQIDRGEFKKVLQENDRSDGSHLLIITGGNSEIAKICAQVGYEYQTLSGSLDSLVSHINELIEKTPKTDADLPHMKPETVGLFYHLLSKVDTFFAEKEIGYWLVDGSLLGAHRHQGMIPWDDDLDVGILEEDLPKLLASKQLLAERGLELVYYGVPGIYKISPSNGKLIEKGFDSYWPWKYPFVDIFVYTKEGDRYVYLDKTFRGKWSYIYYTEEELQQPLAQVPFGPLQVPAPHKIPTIIHRLFGETWNKITYVKWNHELDKRAKKIKVELVDFSAPDYKWPEEKGAVSPSN